MVHDSPRDLENKRLVIYLGWAIGVEDSVHSKGWALEELGEKLT